MTTQLYVVVLRAGAWWVVYDRARLGPYENEAEARQVAVGRAKDGESNGNSAKVWLDDPDDGMPEVYRTGG